MIYPQVQSFKAEKNAAKYVRSPDDMLFVSSTGLRQALAFVEASGLAMPVEEDATLTGFSLRIGTSLVAAPIEIPASGYVIEVTSCGLSLLAGDRSGYYAGLQSIWQLVDNASVSCGRIIDWPTLPVRAFQIDLGRQPETLSELKRLLRQQARYHYNECQLYLENSIKLNALGRAADPEGLTRDEFRELVAFGLALGVEVIPSLNLLGHMEKVLVHPEFAHLSETREGSRHPGQPGGGDLCPSLPETRAFVAEIIREICDISPAKKLMVGLDECWTIGSCPLCREKLDSQGSAGAIFADFICFLHREVAACGKTMWMWEDMLFYHAGSLAIIPRDIGMNIWHYDHVEEYPAYSFQNWRRIDSVRILSKLGHPCMLCGGDGIENLESLFRYGEGYSIDGLLVTQWEGKHVVQELRHAGRAFAAGVLWHGAAGELEDVAAALDGGSRERTRELAPVLRFFEMSSVSGRRSEPSNLPRYWSWAGDAQRFRRQEQFLRHLNDVGVLPESMEVQHSFCVAHHISLGLECIREETAVIGRVMVNRGLKRSVCLDRRIEQLRDLLRLAAAFCDRGRLYHERYASGQKERSMVSEFARLPEMPRRILEALETFQANPSSETWPYPPVSLCLDYSIVDPCTHRVRIEASRDGTEYEMLYAGSAQASPHDRNHACLAVAVSYIPKTVRIEISGFAALGLRHVRLETLEGTRLPCAIVAASGIVDQPEHLLEFNEKMAVFNEPDVMKTWRSLVPPAVNCVVLAFDPECPAIAADFDFEAIIDKRLLHDTLKAQKKLNRVARLDKL